MQLKACDAGKATDVAKLLQEAKEANDPVRGTADDGWKGGSYKLWDTAKLNQN